MVSLLANTFAVTKACN